MGRQGENMIAAERAKRRSSLLPVRMFSRLTMAGAIVLALHVAVSGSAGAQQPGADSPSKALEGRWKLELYLVRESARTTAMAGQINGEIAFSNTAWWNPRDRFGRHSLDLQSFFGRSFLRPANVTPFGPGDTSMVTEISGNIRGDSVNIDFIPRIDHGGISMSGRFWGDSATGTWYRRGTDGEGRFVLRRLTKEPVTVAAIPDGRPVVVATAVVPEKPLTKAELRAKAKADAAAKAKADADARAVARAQALEKAHADALAKTQARDSARAQSVALAKARQDSAALKLAASKAVRDSTAAARLADARAAKDSIAAKRAVANALRDSTAAAKVATAAARKDSIAAARLAARAPRPARPPATTVAANAAPTPTTFARIGTEKTASPAPAAAAPTAAASPAGAAPLRVRTYDIGSNNYFPTKYSLHLPDGHWLYGTLKTGSNPDGWGPVVNRAPGKYEIEVTDFMCGDKIWFLKNKITKQVVIEPGVPTDVTIDIDVHGEPARPSLDNKDGEKCTQPPGGKS